MSDALLDEVSIALKPPSFTVAAHKSGESLNAHVLAEQVKIGSLIRCMELLARLSGDLPQRIGEVNKRIDQVSKDSDLLVEQEKERRKKIVEIVENQKIIFQKFNELLRLIQIRREHEALSRFEKETEWELLKRVKDAQRLLVRRDGDNEILSMKMDKNDDILSQIESLIINF
jgi:hypothetical protein